MSQLSLVNLKGQRDHVNLVDRPGHIDQLAPPVVANMHTEDSIDHMKDSLETEVDQACSELGALTIDLGEERVQT